jgi:hypothetical protein
MTPAPRLLKQKAAADYCGMSVSVFTREYTGPRVRVHPGKFGKRYDLRELDKWINSLPNDTGAVTPALPPTTIQWLDRLDGPSKDPRG